MTEIILKNIFKSYDQTEVIHDFDLKVDSGNFLVLVGPSGCGKSTVLRIIAGLEKITSGEILIDGKDVSNISASERGLAMVFQSYALYPHMSVYKNMAFSLENLKMNKDVIDEKVRSAAKLLQIEEYLERKPKALSGGQRQRVAIGRAIVRDPKAFLFDEPLSNLDAELRVTMRKELSALHDKIGGTMIYVTHDQIEAMTLADQIIVLNDGYVAQSGAPLELYNKPNDLFVAGFIGSPKMNFIKTNISKNQNSESILQSGSLNVQVQDLDINSNKNITIGVRPEHILVGGKEESDIEVKVNYSEQLGSETYFYCSAEGMPQLIVHQAGQNMISKGDNLYLRFDRTCVHLFGSDGKAITNKIK
jgi:multiple sugar transport system ATP-binding protein